MMKLQYYLFNYMHEKRIRQVQNMHKVQDGLPFQAPFEALWYPLLKNYNLSDL